MYDDRAVKDYYDTVTMNILIKTLNDDLMVKKDRVKDFYEFLFIPPFGKKIMSFTLTLVEPEKWLFECATEQMNSERTRKHFRELLCSLGFASYVNHHENIPYKHIYVYDDQPI